MGKVQNPVGFDVFRSTSPRKMTRFGKLIFQDVARYPERRCQTVKKEIAEHLAEKTSL